MANPWDKYQTPEASQETAAPWDKYKAPEQPGGAPGLLGDTKISKDVPSSFMQRMSAYVTPALEMGGAIAGGALAAPVGAIGGIPTGPGAVATGLMAGAAGTGLGFAAGRQAANAYNRFAFPKMKNPGIVQDALQVPVDVATGAAMEAGGQIVGKAMSSGVQALAPQARRLYESTLKIPPSVKRSIREKAVTTGLENKIPVTGKGLEKVESDIESLNAQIAKGIDSLTAEQRLASTMNQKVGYKTYDENMIDMKAVVSRLDDLKKFYRESAPNPKPYLEAINGYKKEILQARGTEMFADKAQKLKQGIYILHRKHYGEMKGIDVEMDKAIARGLKEEIVNKYPELAKLNADDSALINLQTFLERAVNRSGNYDILRLGDQIMTVGGAVAGGPGGAAAAGAVKHILGLPGAKSQLAFALHRASQMAGAAGAAGKIGGMAAVRYGQAPDLVPEAGAATLSDYAKGGTSARSAAIREAAGDNPQTNSYGIPQASTASAPPMSQRRSMNASERAAYDAETERLRSEQKTRGQGKQEKKKIPVRRITIHGKDGDELKFMDAKGRLYDEDPND